jgi:carbonic anhydrase
MVWCYLCQTLKSFVAIGFHKRDIMPEFRALLDGYKRFRQETYNRYRLRYDALANKGQEPKIMVIACCDSRVDPAAVFDAEPGQMFVLRNVANLVPPCDPHGTRFGAASAAVEYAVTGLNVEHIIVMGHARCGGIHAALNQDFGDPKNEKAQAEQSFTTKWMSLIRPQRDQVLQAYKVAPDMDPQRTLELAAIRQSLENLRTFPFVAAREAERKLKLHGAFFDIADGILRLLSPGDDRFEPVPLDWQTQSNINDD